MVGEMVEEVEEGMDEEVTSDTHRAVDCEWCQRRVYLPRRRGRPPIYCTDTCRKWSKAGRERWRKAVRGIRGT